MRVSERVYNFSKKILKLYEKKETDVVNKETEKPYVKEEKRVIGSTDYKKYEDLSKKIELEEITKSEKTNDILKMGCNNDRRKERQLLDKPSKDKLEAAKIFKTEGDDNLKLKQWEDAVNSYEKALLQLFYTFSDEPEEDKQVEKLKMAINSNLSMCKINLSRYDEAIGYCDEVLRIDKNNIKAIYRIAFSYFKKDQFEESYKFIDKGLEIEKDNSALLELKNDIVKRKQYLDNESKKLFKKIIK